MKTLIDAVNEFEGDMGCYNYIFVGTNKNKLNRGVSQLTLSTLDNDSWRELCGRHEFLATVAECETNFGKCIPYAEYKTEYARKEKVIIMLDELHKLTDDPVKELDVFINCTYNNDPQPAPVFTQAMADNGELPSVGMLVMMRGSKRIILLGPDSGGDYITINEHGSYDFDSANKFKPLTPPIELIDGKAYQFDVRGKEGIVNGIYNDYDKKLHIGQDHYFDLISATNIQPLTVEVK